MASNALSHIPYKDRMLMNKFKTIKEHRDHAAQVALKVACVALNDTEGLSYVRLSRFAIRLQQLMKEYYDQMDVQEQHLNERLETMGFIIQNGHLFCVQNSETDEIMSKKVLEVEDARWQDYEHGWRCSRCHEVRRRKSNYCPDCGVRMQNGKT